MRYFTVSEAAEALQLSVPTIKRYIYDGQLKSTKLPGGQHRIPESEVERLLGAPVPERPATPDGDLAERIAVLERWVTEEEAEIERLNAALQVMSRYCASRCDYTEEPSPAASPLANETPTVLVLGPGCRKCRSLRDLAERVLQALGRTDVTVQTVQDLDAISAFGPVLTPTLVVNGQIVLSGRVPTERILRQLLQSCLS